MRCAGCGVELVGHPACPGCATAAPADAVFPFTVPDLPPAPWVLTAPESYVLRYGFTDRTARLGAFKAALTELLARRALTLDAAYFPRRLAPGVRGVWLISDGPGIDATPEPALAPVLDAYRRARPRRAFTRADKPVAGLLTTDLLRAATNRRGGLRGYLRRDLAGALERRGLLTADRRLTDAGRQADHELERWIELGRGRFAHRAARDETWARDYVAGAGATLLLISTADPAIARLSAATAAALTADQAYAFAVGPQGADGAGVLDFSALAGGALTGLDGAFAVLDASFAGFDGGGGGDGGGIG